MNKTLQFGIRTFMPVVVRLMVAVGFAYSVYVLSFGPAVSLLLRGVIGLNMVNMIYRHVPDPVLHSYLRLYRHIDTACYDGIAGLDDSRESFYLP